jgi:MraZ protein
LWRKLPENGAKSLIMPINDFSGEYRFALDNKKRINIPAGIRKMLPPESEGTLIFTRGFEGCVYVYPFDEWQRLTKKLNTLDSFQVKVRNFIRQFVGSAFKTVMDTQGRVLLPDKVLEMAGITKEVLLLGSLNKWELWDPEKYEQYFRENVPAMEQLAQEINFSAIFNNSDE